MVVFSRRLWFWVSVPATLPGLVFAALEIVDCVVAADEPPNIDANIAYCGRILRSV